MDDPALNGMATEQSGTVSLDSDQHDATDPRVCTKLALARRYFYNTEFDRVSVVLRDIPGDSSLFVRLFAKFMSGEKRKADASLHTFPPTHTKVPVNEEAAKIRRELADLHASSPIENALLLFLYGTVARVMESTEEAVQLLIRSIHLDPWNWSAWLELSRNISSHEMWSSIEPRLPESPATDYFYVYTAQTMAHAAMSEQVEARLNSLYRWFPNSLPVKSLHASWLHCIREHEMARSMYKQVLEQDPYRLEDLEALSNIFFVSGDVTELAAIAQRCVHADPYRPETLIVLGNYYSMRREHEKAVREFERAIRVDRQCLPAWTLMGHEYVEMKNENAAVASYRRALDINPLDYRAWNGLGQAYELNTMYKYAIYYYQKAVALRPRDPRLWFALGNCYELLKRPAEATQCYLRAHAIPDVSTPAALRLGRCYDSYGKHELAEYYFREVWKQKSEENTRDEDLAMVLMKLGGYAKKKGNFAQAEEYFREASELKSDHKNMALAELRELKSRIEAPARHGQ